MEEIVEAALEPGPLRFTRTEEEAHILTVWMKKLWLVL